MRISQVLSSKPGEVVTIAPEATVRELIAALSEHNIGAIVVSDDGSQVRGIVSERDVVRSLVADESVLDSPVESIMTREVHTVTPDLAVDELMSVMTERRIRHVPVVVEGALTGIISIGDVVKSRIGELEFERDQLGSYLQG